VADVRWGSHDHVCPDFVLHTVTTTATTDQNDSVKTKKSLLSAAPW